MVHAMVFWEYVFNMFTTMMTFAKESHIIHQEWFIKHNQAPIQLMPNQEFTTPNIDKFLTPSQESAITNLLVMSITLSLELTIINHLDMWLMQSQETTTHHIGQAPTLNQFQDQRSITHHQDK